MSGPNRQARTLNPTGPRAVFAIYADCSMRLASPNLRATTDQYYLTSPNEKTAQEHLHCIRLSQSDAVLLGDPVTLFGWCVAPDVESCRTFSAPRICANVFAEP